MLSGSFPSKASPCYVYVLRVSGPAEVLRIASKAFVFSRYDRGEKSCYAKINLLRISDTVCNFEVSSSSTHSLLTKGSLAVFVEMLSSSSGLEELNPAIACKRDLSFGTLSPKSL